MQTVVCRRWVLYLIQATINHIIPLGTILPTSRATTAGSNLLCMSLPIDIHLKLRMSKSTIDLQIKQKMLFGSITQLIKQ